MTLRPYQAHALDELCANLATRPVLVIPTGGGKTVVAAELVNRLGRRTLWLAHRRELIQQAAQSLIRLGLRCGVIMAGQTPDPAAPVQVASIQTLARRTAPSCDLIVLDEAHHARATTYRSVLDQYPGVPVVGLTATPFRLDGRGLGELFGRLVVAAHADELCADGTLIEPIVYAPAVPDLTGVHVRHGDYVASELATAMTKRKLVGDIVATWLRRAEGRRTIVFAVTVAHARQIAEAFCAVGVRAEQLDGGTSKPQRDAILHRLRVGYTSVVTNCAVLTEGWDLPALEVAIVARPTTSLCLHLQMIGRIMRAADGKAGAVVLDHAGNHFRLGTVTQRVDYSLDDNIAPARDRQGGGDRVKRCMACYLVCAPHATECPACGQPFAAAVPQSEPGELVEFRPFEFTPGVTHDEQGNAVALRPSLDVQQAGWDALDEQRRAAGYREGWTYHRFHERFGFRPLVHQGVVCDPQTVGPEVRRAVLERFHETARERGYKPGWAAYQYKAIFGRWPPRAASAEGAA